MFSNLPALFFALGSSCWAKYELPKPLGEAVSEGTSAPAPELCVLALSLQHPASCEGVEFGARTVMKVGGVSPRPCLFGTVQIIVSNYLSEPWCYLDWPFPPQVTGCRLAGERRGGSMIRPDQNGGVWCSLCRCHTHQTVRCPHQVWRSSRKAEILEVENDSKLHSSIFSCVSAAPLTSALVYILYCVCVEVSRRVGRCRCVRQPAGGGKMNQCKRINISSSHTRRKNKFTPLSR